MPFFGENNKFFSAVGSFFEIFARIAERDDYIAPAVQKEDGHFKAGDFLRVVENLPRHDVYGQNRLDRLGEAADYDNAPDVRVQIGDFARSRRTEGITDNRNVRVSVPESLRDKPGRRPRRSLQPRDARLSAAQAVSAVVVGKDRNSALGVLFENRADFAQVLAVAVAVDYANVGFGRRKKESRDFPAVGGVDKKNSVALRILKRRRGEDYALGEKSGKQKQQRVDATYRKEGYREKRQFSAAASSRIFQ